MEAELSRASGLRAQHRHELRTLTYVILDQSNGGVVRDLTSDGLGLQIMTTVPPGQQMQVRFELRNPRLRVEARGEMVWSTFSGLCGMRFVDLPPRFGQQIREWIFGDMLQTVSVQSARPESIFSDAAAEPEELLQDSPAEDGDDGLMISAAPRNVIELPSPLEAQPEPTLVHREATEVPEETPVPLDWLSQPLSARGLAWTVNVLVVVAGLLLFALVFLSVVGSAPPWPLAVLAGVAGLVTLMYWGFFQVFGGSSLGARLARIAGGNPDEEDSVSARFR